MTDRDGNKADVNLSEIAAKLIRLQAYTRETGVVTTKSQAGLLRELAPDQTSEVVDMIVAARVGGRR